MLRFVDSMDSVLPNALARAEVRAHLAEALAEAAAQRGTTTLTTPDGFTVQVGSAVLQFLQDALEQDGRLAYVTNPSEALVSPEDAAQLMGVSRPFVYKLLDRGELPTVSQVGKRRRTSVSAALAWVEGQQAAAQVAEDVAELAAQDPVAPSRAELREALRVARSTGEYAGVRGLEQRRAAARVAEGVKRQAAH